VKYYFQLQTIFWSRRFREAGFNPLFAAIFLVSIFVGASFFLFKYVDRAPYIFSGIAFFLTTLTSNKSKSDFLSSTFKDTLGKQIELAEKMLVLTPFVVFLLCKLEFILTGSLILITCTSFLMRFGFSGGKSIPTPFSKHPFEFAVGFRRLFWLLLPIYGLTCIAMMYDNYNLGVFSLLAVIAVVINFYNEVEDELFVWNFSKSVNQFLGYKIRIGLIYATSLVLPILIALLVFYLSNWWVTLAFLVVGLAFLSTYIVAKYAAFPQRINFVDGLVIMICIPLPVLLIFIFPYFYGRAKNALTVFLP